jgi:hypothetical protein
MKTAVIVLLAFVLVAPASAALTKQQKISRSESVVNWYENRGAWSLRPGFKKCSDIRASRAGDRCYRHRQGYRFHLERLRALRPPPVAHGWGPHAFPDSCLRELSRRESAGTFSPTIWNTQGSGAYGIGQALPAEKMAPHGADYMTNPWTQLRWMISYVNGRYGGSCAALAFHNAHGWY